VAALILYKCLLFHNDWHYPTFYFPHRLSIRLGTAKETITNLSHYICLARKERKETAAMYRRHLHTADNGNTGNHGSSDPVSLSSVTTLDTGAPVVATARPDPIRAKRRRRKLLYIYDPDGVGIIIGLIVFFLIGVGIVLMVQERPTNASVVTNLFETVVMKPKTLHRENPNYSIGDEKIPLDPSGKYQIPGSLSHIGDKSDQYVALRKEIDQLFPLDQQRSLQAVERLKKYEFHSLPMQDNSDSDSNAGNSSSSSSSHPNPMPYDIYNCPEEPPEHYPYHWNTLQLLKHWPPNEPNVRQDIYQGLCVFDYHEDYGKALTYRTRELPFVVRGDPSVAAAVERWNMNGIGNTRSTSTSNYMDRMLGNVKHRAEYSETNHFLFWKPGRRKNTRGGGDGKPRWKAPTKMIRMKYADWLSHANVTDESLLAGPDQPHWYFRLIGCGETGPHGECDTGSSEYLFDELTFFQPKTTNPSLYMVQPEKQDGIHCRFGMKGVIAENHFDGSRNAIVVLGGERRYILSPPDQCQNLALLPKGHPSARHSAIDWSEEPFPDLEQFPQFADARSNEVVLQAGDVLYLPTHWFHYIISLSLNYQCNTRSGKNNKYRKAIRECGF
jgi:hypothetical protein